MKVAGRIIPKKDQIKYFWNEFSNFYAHNVEEHTLKSSLSLSRMLKLSSAQSILEVGCGSGTLSLYWLQKLTPPRKYISVDFSENMIKMAQSRKKSLKEKINNIEHSFIVGDAENLEAIGNDTIDVYISPLCLHVIPDVNKGLQEAMRVTKKGGRIGFSVLGPYEENSYFRLADERIKEALKEKPDGPDIHHLGNKGKLVKLAKDAGIKVEYCWAQDTVYDALDENGVEDIIKNSTYAQNFEELSKELKNRVVGNIMKDVMNIRKDYIPLRVNEILLVGRKPE